MQQNQVLAFKPDADEARRRWNAFWAGDLIDRPVIHITAPREGLEPVPGPRYMAGADGNFDEAIELAVESASRTFWGGDAMPNYVPSFGPDQFAAFLGAELKISPHSSGTSWAVPFVDDWSEVLPLRIDPANQWWQRMQEFYKRLADATRGKMLVAHLDLHSNMDALLAIRGGQRLCEDLMDCPELVEQALMDVRALYPIVYDTLFKLGEMDVRGSTSWIPVYGTGKTCVMQCDFACMVGPEMFRRFVLPALEEEANFLDHSIYHYDGPDALVHLDDILSIKALHAIQWVPGAGNKPFIEWMDLLKRIQQAGKAVWVSCSPGELPTYHKQLAPNKVFYVCSAKTEKEARDVLHWLERNT